MSAPFEQDLEAIKRASWWAGFTQCLVVVAIGAALGCAYALGYLFELHGGWHQ